MSSVKPCPPETRLLLIAACAEGKRRGERTRLQPDCKLSRVCVGGCRLFGFETPLSGNPKVSTIFNGVWCKIRPQLMRDADQFLMSYRELHCEMWCFSTFRHFLTYLICNVCDIWHFASNDFAAHGDPEIRLK